MIKFSHTIFAMPFALIGFFLSVKHNPNALSWVLLFKVILCMIFARSAAMAFNRYLDRHIDSKNPRTANREIPVGQISAKNALLFTVLNALLFVITTYFINSLCLMLSPIALLVVLGYSYTKRYTALCHLVLGCGLALAPIGAYLAVASQFKVLPLLFSFTVLFWVSGFDIIYALQDEEFDRKEKLSSIPVLLGRKNALLTSRLLHFCSAFFILLTWLYGDFGKLYPVACLLFIGILAFHHSLVKENDLSRVNLAFFTSNGIASGIFAVITLIDLYIW